MFCIKMWFFLSPVADDESEPEEDRSQEDAKEPRDSGCFESSENLEPKMEEEVQDEASEKQKSQEAEKREQETEQQDEKQTEQLDTVQEQLQELTVVEGSWKSGGGKKILKLLLLLVLRDSVDACLLPQSKLHYNRVDWW